jgi:hypothetical protein
MSPTVTDCGKNWLTSARNRGLAVANRLTPWMSETQLARMSLEAQQALERALEWQRAEGRRLEACREKIEESRRLLESLKDLK